MENKKRQCLPVYILFCYLLSFYTGFNMSGTQFVLLDMKTEFGLSSTLMAVISSAQLISSLAMSLLFSKLLDHMDNKKVLLAGSFCSIAGALFAGFSGGPMITLVSYIISGVGSNMLLSAPFPGMAKLDPEHITLHLNRQQGALSCGAFISPLIMALLFNDIGLSWRWAYYISAIMLCIITICFLFVPSPGKPGEISEYPEETVEEKKIRKRIILTPAFLCMGICLGLYMVMEIGLLGYAKDYFMIGMNDILGASLCISIVRGGMTISRLFGERVIKNRVWMSILTMGLSGVSLLLMAIFRIPVVSLIWCGLFGLFAGPCWPTILSMGLSLDTRSSGKLSSILMIFNNIGNNLGNLLIGACVDTLGIRRAYYVAASIAILGILLLIIGVRSFRKLKKIPEGPEWLWTQQQKLERIPRLHQT